MAEDRKEVWPLVRENFTRALGLERGVGSMSEMFQNQMMVLQQLKTTTAKDCLVASGSSNPFNGPADWQGAFSTNILSAQAELMEALESTNWKPWKTSFGKPLTTEQLRELQCELVDVLCFILNLWALTGGTGVELFALHKAKCLENLRRQKVGY